MNKEIKVILLIALAVLVLGGILAFTEAKNPQTSNSLPDEPTKLEATNTNYDFGKISMADGNVEYIYQIINTADEPVEINRIYTSCMCTQAILYANGQESRKFGMLGHEYTGPVNQTIESGDTLELKTIFDPNAHGPAGVGPTVRQIGIETKEGSPLFLTFKADVTP